MMVFKEPHLICSFNSLFQISAKEKGREMLSGYDCSCTTRIAKVNVLPEVIGCDAVESQSHVVGTAACPSGLLNRNTTCNEMPKAG